MTYPPPLSSSSFALVAQSEASVEEEALKTLQKGTQVRERKAPWGGRVSGLGHEDQGGEGDLGEGGREGGREAGRERFRGVGGMIPLILSIHLEGGTGGAEDLGLLI